MLLEPNQRLGTVSQTLDWNQIVEAEVLFTAGKVFNIRLPDITGVGIRHHHVYEFGEGDVVQCLVDKLKAGSANSWQVDHGIEAQFPKVLLEPLGGRRP